MPAIHRHLLALNERASADFDAAESARARHRALHPTPLAAVKCMDERVLFPKLTDTPVGLVQPFRAIGGRPEVYWPSFMGRLRRWVEEARAGVVGRSALAPSLASRCPAATAHSEEQRADREARTVS